MPRVRKPGTRNNRAAETPKVPSGRGYGERQQLEQAMSAVPIPTRPDMAQVSDAAARYQPNAVPLSAPTQRPDEPVTAGVPMGPGAGQDFAMARHDPTAGIVEQLEALYMRWPTRELGYLLREARGGR